MKYWVVSEKIAVLIMDVFFCRVRYNCCTLCRSKSLYRKRTCNFFMSWHLNNERYVVRMKIYYWQAFAVFIVSVINNLRKESLYYRVELPETLLRWLLTALSNGHNYGVYSVACVFFLCCFLSVSHSKSLHIDNIIRKRPFSPRKLNKNIIIKNSYNGCRLNTVLLTVGGVA